MTTTAHARLISIETLRAEAEAGTDRTALIFGDRSVGYTEFALRVRQVAARLDTAGVRPGDPVAVSVERSIELVVAVHAILALGAVYVPIDPELPAERCRHMMETADVRAVVIAQTAEQPSWSGCATVVRIDCSGPVGDVRPIDGFPTAVDAPAFTLFTSGSTGVPKGVTNTRAGLWNRLRRSLVPMTADDVFLHKTPIGFDFSLWEILYPIMVGGTLVIAEPGGHRDPMYLHRMIQQHRVTVVHFVPAMLSAFLDVLGDAVADMTSLRIVFSGGEALTSAVADSLRSALSQIHVVNQYGPTEAAIDVLAYAVTDDRPSVPIGRPVPGVEAYVLDEGLSLVPIGVPGELYVGGVQVAHGYAGQTALTAERFVADPFGTNGGRLYRTGDRARWSADGQIEYLGRTDFQVKLRGQRLELGEVEAAIAAVDGVVHAVANVVETAGGPRLVGYVEPAGLDADVVAEQVALRLPEYMRPTAWMMLESVPLNAAGKVDRRALPIPEITVAEFVAPATDAEEAVAALYSDLLGLETVSVTESFFDLGGNSLSATRIAARVSNALGVEVSVRDVFDTPSVRELVAAVAVRGAGLRPITRVEPRPDTVPLSFAQQRMWFINQLEPQSGAYNIPLAVRLDGRLDLEAFRCALSDVVVRNEILRTTYSADSRGVGHQVIHPADRIDDVVDLVEVDTMAELLAGATRGFDVAVELPVRALLWRESADSAALLIVVHHIAGDGQSLRPLLMELISAYAARVTGHQPGWQPRPIQFADYALWQHRELGSVDDPNSVVSRQLDYWLPQLTGLPDVLELPSDRPRPAVATMAGAKTEFSVSAEVAARITDVAAALGATPFMVVHAALAAVLSRLSATEDIAIGTHVGGRGQAVLDDMIGMFVNTLVLRTQVDGSMTFADLLDQTRRVDLDAFAHSDIPFEQLVERLNPVRSQAFAPLMQVQLSFNQDGSSKHDGSDDGAGIGDLDVAGLRMSTLDPGDPVAQVDLTVGLWTAPEGNDWTGSIIYATDLFDESTIVAFADRLVRLLDESTADPSLVIGDVDLRSIEERDAGRDLVSGAARPVADAVLPDLVFAQAARTPDAIALEFDGRAVTFQEFAVGVGHLARRLIAAGTGPDSAVAVCMPRSIDMMLAIHAISAAGGAYVPIDPGVPADRVRYMLETAGAETVLVSATDGTTAAITTLQDTVQVIPVDAIAAMSVDRSIAVPITDEDRIAPLRPGNAAYTLFTSGSTGRPKGVTLSHRAVINRLWWGLDELPIDHTDAVVLKTPYTFDCSVPEIYAPLMVGARTVIATAEGHLDPLYLCDLIEDTGATMVHFVPSMLAVFLEIAGRDRIRALTTVKYVSTTGEALPPAVAAETIGAFANAELYNLYGPTEAAVEITYAKVEADADAVTVPIGVPVWNSTAYVLDDRLHPVVPGSPGELYVGGVQLARGYAARADLTAERFVADPFGAPGDRLYRTGDLVRHGADGGLEYLGRTDFQVKLRGQRIELGEVDAVLSGMDRVVHAVTTVAQAPGGGEHLVAYLSGGPDEPIDLAEIQVEVARVLPEYMRPTVWTVVDEIALNTAGKIDRKALPAPDFSASEEEFVEPDGEQEILIAEVFSDVLGVDQTSATASFFHLGGNSLSATQVLAQLRERIDPAIELSWIFDDPTVRGLARRIDSGRSGSDVLLGLRTAGSRPPLFCVHPAGGLAWFYGGLAPYLDDRPIYGLQDPAVASDEDGAESVTELALRYVDEITEVSPHGPYHLLGWSLGGLVAHAMAVELQRRGEKVSFLGIMDASPNDSFEDRESTDGIDSSDAADTATDSVRTAADAVHDAAATARDLLGGWRELFNLGDEVKAERPDDVATVIRDTIVKTGLLTEEQVHRVMSSFERSDRMVPEHRASTYDGPMLLFTAVQDKPEGTDLAAAWQPYVTGSIVGIDVDTHHLGMADSDALAIIGPALEEALINSE